MRWAEGFVAVDWGTTNRRAYRIDGSGACVSSSEDDLGVLSVEAGGFPAAVDDIRAQFGDLPLLLAGMVGSTRGWIDVPYVRCPAGLDDLAGQLHWVVPDRVAIVPGLSISDEGHADVMRGEEVQLFGAVAAGLIPATGVVCHPGTHNKWVGLEDGRIIGFRTVMTGEIFNLLRKHSILAELLGSEVQEGEMFAAGVRRGLASPPLTAELFSVRAGVLLGEMERESAASFTSGLLIGIDLKAGLDLAERSEIYFMGRPDLTNLYAAAASEAGLVSNQVDGAQAFLAGAAAIARTLQ